MSHANEAPETIEPIDAIEAMLITFATAWNVAPPEGDDLEIKLRAYAVALKGATADEIQELTERVITSHHSAWLPNTGDVLKIRDTMNGHSPRGAANTSAYETYDPNKHRAFMLPGQSDAGQRGQMAQQLNRQRFAAGQLAVQCECVTDTAKNGHKYYRTAIISPDMTHWVCETGECNFRVPIEQTKVTPARAEMHPIWSGNAVDVAPAPAAPVDLVTEAVSRCALCVEDLPSNAAQSFAEHLRGLCGVEMWTAALAREEWPIWLAAGGAAFWQREAVAS